MQTNPGCASCDYFNTCNKTLIFKNNEGDSVKVPAKKQSKIKMRCVNIVQKECKSCVLFQEKRCASWQVLNGKTINKGTLANCPKKVPLNDLVKL